MGFTTETAIAAARKRHGPVKYDGRTYPVGSALEARYMQMCVDIGRVTLDENGNAVELTRQSWRRLAKRLGDDETALRLRRIHDPKPAAVSDDEDLLIAHLTAEASRMRARARRDRQIADEHERIADDVERDLARRIFELGIVK